MNVRFSPLILPEYPRFLPHKLIEITKILANSSSFTSLEKLKDFPLMRSRSIDLIFADIQHGKAKEVNRLEWVYCIQTMAIGAPEYLEAVSDTIWQFATQDLWLSRLLLWRLALYHSDRSKKVLAPQLADGFTRFASIIKRSQPIPVKIIEALARSQPDQEVSAIALDNLLTPSKLLTSANLPPGIPVVEKALDCVARHFSDVKLPKEQQVKWLLNCLNEMSLQQQINAVEILLTQVPIKVGSSFPLLVGWLREHYNPQVIGERWYKLSERAKRALREWIGAVNYNDFANLIDKLLQVLSLKKWEENQLESRRNFWFKYSNRFERLRILLPQTSMNCLESKVFVTDIEILAIDGSTDTEVCIFDFGEWFVVEFFRGQGSEIRLFRRNAQIEQVLFGSPKLSVKKIRRLGGEKHDHVFLWQVYCPEWLQNKGIYPNPGTPPPGQPTEDDKQKRPRKLKWWKHEIKKLEREAGEYRVD